MTDKWKRGTRSETILGWRTRMTRIQGALETRDFSRGGFRFAARTAAMHGGHAKKQCARLLG